MKSIFRLLFGLVVLGAALPAIAQERAIDQNEYNSAYRGAVELLKETAFRLTRTYSGQYGEGPQFSYTDMVEFVPPDRRRNLYVGRSEKGTQKTDRISIGNMRYIRKNEGPWTIEPELPANEIARGVGMGNGTGSGKPMKESKRTLKFKSIGGEKIGGEDAELHERKEIVKYTGDDGKSIKTTSTHRVWYNKDGRFLKTELRNEDNSGKIIYHTVGAYEYGPHIRIEAPAVEPAGPR